jgi:hypothetical protein
MKIAITITANPFNMALKVMQVALRLGSRLPAYMGANAPTVSKATDMVFKNISLKGSLRRLNTPKFSLEGILMFSLMYLIPDFEKLCNTSFEIERFTENASTAL